LIGYTITFASSVVLYCPPLLAQCKLNIQSVISSGWNKDNVSYTVEKNKLKLKVADKARDDADSIYIGSIEGCKTLIVDVVKVSGNYPWGGKIIGFSFFNEKLDPKQWGNQASFPPPRNRAIDDGFVKELSASDGKLVYDIARSGSAVHFGAKVFIGGGNVLELEFGTEAAPSPLLQASARQAIPAAKRNTASAVRQSRNDSRTCSAQCHEPPGQDEDFDFIGEFSIPPAAACPHRND
jgi:hypothetical protein